LDIYLAKGLSEGEQELDVGEFLDVFTVPFAEVLEWVRTGQITDVTTIISAFWLEKIQRGEWLPPKR
jgi:ADP-ribose pyrophosphatase